MSKDKFCPNCGRLIVGSGEFLSVSSYLHAETPGECRPLGFPWAVRCDLIKALHVRDEGHECSNPVSPK